MSHPNGCSLYITLYSMQILFHTELAYTHPLYFWLNEGAYFSLNTGDRDSWHTTYSRGRGVPH